MNKEYEQMIRTMLRSYKRKNYYEDLCQDLRITAMHCLETYDPKKSNAKFKTYLFKALRVSKYNNLKNYMFAMRIPRHVKVTEDMNLSAKSCDFEDVQSTYLNYENVEHNLKIAKNILTEKEYELLVLHIKGYKQSELAEMRGVSRQAINDTFNRMRNKLKGKYEEV